MWQPHQFLIHLAEPQLEVSAFIYILIIKYKIPKRPYQNIRFYLYLATFSLLLFIFLTWFSLSPLSLSCSSSSSPGSLSLSSFSFRPSRSSFSSWPWRYSLSHLSLYGCGGPLSLLFLSVRLAGVFNLYNTDFFFFFSPRFSICTVFFFFSYITIIVNLYSISFCIYWFFSRYSTGYFFFIIYNHCC
jgi:hypothetical protein